MLADPSCWGACECEQIEQLLELHSISHKLLRNYQSREWCLFILFCFENLAFNFQLKCINFLPPAEGEENGDIEQLANEIDSVKLNGATKNDEEVEDEPTAEGDSEGQAKKKKKKKRGGKGGGLYLTVNF